MVKRVNLISWLSNSFWPGNSVLGGMRDGQVNNWVPARTKGKGKLILPGKLYFLHRDGRGICFQFIQGFAADNSHQENKVDVSVSYIWCLLACCCSSPDQTTRKTWEHTNKESFCQENFFCLFSRSSSMKMLTWSSSSSSSSSSSLLASSSVALSSSSAAAALSASSVAQNSKRAD